MSTLGLKARTDPLLASLHSLYAMDSSDSPLVRHLLTSWKPALRPRRFRSTYLRTYKKKHWGSSLGSHTVLNCTLPKLGTFSNGYLEILLIQCKCSFDLKMTASLTVENNTGETRTVQTQTAQTAPNEQQRFVFVFYSK